jgi:hypothetical protein
MTAGSFYRHLFWWPLCLAHSEGTALASASGRSELGGKQQRKPFSTGNCTTASCPTMGLLKSMARRPPCSRKSRILLVSFGRSGHRDCWKIPHERKAASYRWWWA